MGDGCDTSLAEYASWGHLLTLYCVHCRSPRVSLTSGEIIDRFGDNLLASLDEICARLRCEACGGRGGWHSGFADLSPEVAMGQDGERLSVWRARDLYLRHLLQAHSRPLEIADHVWARVEGKLRDYHDWEPRLPARDGSPLSAAGAAALAETGRMRIEAAG